MKENEEELSIDEILATIRNVLWDKEVQKSASRSCIRDYEKERFYINLYQAYEFGYNSTSGNK